MGVGDARGEAFDTVLANAETKGTADVVGCREVGVLLRPKVVPPAVRQILTSPAVDEPQHTNGRGQEDGPLLDPPDEIAHDLPRIAPTVHRGLDHNLPREEGLGSFGNAIQREEALRAVRQEIDDEGHQTLLDQDLEAGQTLLGLEAALLGLGPASFGLIVVFGRCFFTAGLQQKLAAAIAIAGTGIGGIGIGIGVGRSGRSSFAERRHGWSISPGCLLCYFVKIWKSDSIDVIRSFWGSLAFRRIWGGYRYRNVGATYVRGRSTGRYGGGREAATCSYRTSTPPALHR